MARIGKNILLAHLFAAVKAKVDDIHPSDDLAKAEFLAEQRMPCQRKVAQDPSRKKSVRCPRRAGKSWVTLSIALEACLRKRGSIWVIIGLARPSVKEIFWGLLKKLSLQLELALTFKEVDLIAEFPNGSRLLFRGGETLSEIEKLRGGQYDGAIIDECKSFAPTVFIELVEDVLEPALNDRLGTLILIGTPGDILAGPFYEATCEPPIEFTGADGVVRHSNHLWGMPVTAPYVWSLHTWTLQDNIECPWLWEEALKTKNIRGWADAHATWRREYLGHWVASVNKIVYRYFSRVHDYDGKLPEHETWIHVLGLDPGYKDADAIVIWAYSATSFDVYQVYGEKRKKQNITQLAYWLQRLVDEYKPQELVYDPSGGGAKVIAELAEIHRLYFTEPAEKRDKNAYIELFNNELDAKRLHILPPRFDEERSTLADEMLGHRWLEKTIGTEKRKEDPKTPNDLCDASLYAWRVCDHRRPVPKDRKVDVQSEEWWKNWKAEQLLKATAEHLARKAGGLNDMRNMDKDWWSHAGHANDI